jgi:Putative RNA methylase family UPF0020
VVTDVVSSRIPWNRASTVATDCSLHQLAPYIGRLKTSIAKYLVTRYTTPGQTVVDPFCGSGVVALESVIHGRAAFASDISPYAVLLTKGKLFAPPTEREALEQLTELRSAANARLASQDLRSVPQWVRKFFHSSTLREALAYRDACVDLARPFLFSCLLGILHHQRPGFLSYPASHLVPYLRDKQFPRRRFSSLYEYREVYPRLERKVLRSYRRPLQPGSAQKTVIMADASAVKTPRQFGAIITSPPYMNSLDYIRDNRLRLWFIDRHLPAPEDIPRRKREDQFRSLMHSTLCHLIPNLQDDGICALILGDVNRNGAAAHPATIVEHLVSETPQLAQLKLVDRFIDSIPDIRRSRRDCVGTKAEVVLVFRQRRHSRAKRSHGSR